MAKARIEQDQRMGFPYVKIEGDLTVNNFTALHFLVKGATKFGTVPVIVDLSGELNVTDEVKEIGCWRTRAAIPGYANKITLIVIGATERLEEIRALLTPHDLQHALSLREAIDILNNGHVSG